MRILNKIFIVIIEAMAAYFITKLFNISSLISINIGYLIGVIIILLSIFFFIMQYVLKVIEESKENKEKVQKLSARISNMNQIKLDMQSNKGDRLLLMSLSKSIYEPLKISLLEKAVENNNVLAALMLANLYYSGIKHEGKCVLPRSPEKAAEIYIKIKEHDVYGVSEWELGWFYENNLIEDAKNLSESERLKKARKYYEESVYKGYAKAHNSIGKFLYRGWGGLNRSFTEAMENYRTAAKNDDVYGIMNCGLISMDKYYENSKEKAFLEEAEKYFIHAASYNDAEGLLQLGIVYEIKIQDNIKYLNNAKKYYLKVATIAKNQYSATAYYRLGKLLNNHSDLQRDTDIINVFNNIKHQDLAIECFTRAYNIFQSLDLNGDRLDGKYRECFDNLIQVFKNIK